MKNFIKTTVLFVFVLLLSACSKDNIESQQPTNADLQQEVTTNNSRKKIKVDVTLTSNEGCEIHIQGDLDVDISIFSGVTINGFEGTVSFSGGSGCPNGSLTFGGRSNGSLVAYLDRNTCKDLTKVTWEGPSEVADILNEERSNIAIVNAIKATCK